MSKKHLRLQDVRRILGRRVAQHMRKPVIKLPHEPRDYQIDTLDRIGKWLRSKKQERSSYVCLATGLGKTMIFSMLVSLCRDMRVLIIVPNKTLVVQTVMRLRGYAPGLVSQVSSLRSIKGHDGEVLAVHGAHHDIVVTTDESFKRNPSVFGKPNLIIWDEFHWAYSDKARKALKRFPDSVVIGFSATPDFLTPEARRGYHKVAIDSGLELYADPSRMAATHFGTNLITLGPVWGITNGWLADLAWGRIDFKVSLDSVPMVKTTAGLDYKESDLCAELQKNWGLMVGAICHMYKSGKPLNVVGRRAYAVCPSVRMAEQLAKELCEVGLKAVCIHGSTPDTERNEMLAAYDRGEIDFISSVMVLREGWDAPGAEVCWMLRPTRSRVLYVQVIGRVLRKNGNGKVAMVIDPHFSGTKLAPLSIPQLFMPPGKVRSGQVIVRKGTGVVRGGGDDWQTPYLPKGVDPTIVEIKPIETVLPGDEDWKTAAGWAREFGLAPQTVRKHLKTEISEQRRDLAGDIGSHYHRAVVTRVFADFLNANTADENWKTPKSWAKEFGLSHGTMGRLLAGQPGEVRRSPSGALHTHYHRSVVMKACPLLQNIKNDDDEWKTVSAWAKEIGVSLPTVRTRLGDQRSELRRDSTGQIRPHYHRSQVMEACGGFLNSKVSENDWKTVNAWAKDLGLSRRAVLNRIQDHPSEQRRDSVGRLLPHYYRSVVMKACADLIAKRKPKRKKSG